MRLIKASMGLLARTAFWPSCHGHQGQVSEFPRAGDCCHEMTISMVPFLRTIIGSIPVSKKPLYRDARRVCMNSFNWALVLARSLLLTGGSSGWGGTIFFFAGVAGLSVCIFGFQSSRNAAKKALAAFSRGSSLKTW
jgi:hypothetical protein